MNIMLQQQASAKLVKQPCKQVSVENIAAEAVVSLNIVEARLAPVWVQENNHLHSTCHGLLFPAGSHLLRVSCSVAI